MRTHRSGPVPRLNIFVSASKASCQRVVGYESLTVRLTPLSHGEQISTQAKLPANDRPGGTEALALEWWDMGGFAGPTAVIQIADQAAVGWGHINVDHIIQTDHKPPGTVTNAKREFRIEKHCLNIPIKNGAPKRVVTTIVDGQVAVRNDIEVANAEPDWWAPRNVSAWRGKTVTLQVDKLPEDSAALGAIEPGDSIQDWDNLELALGVKAGSAKLIALEVHELESARRSQ